MASEMHSLFIMVSKAPLLECNAGIELNKPLVEHATFGDPESVSPSTIDDIKVEYLADDGVDTYHADLGDYVNTFASFDGDAKASNHLDVEVSGDDDNYEDDKACYSEDDRPIARLSE
jgi:hypothetical protein